MFRIISGLKYLVITCLIMSLGYGQSSHKGLTTELLRDLQKSIADSTSIPGDSLQLKFLDNSKLEIYLNTCLTETATTSEGFPKKQVEITDVQALLSINHISNKSVRNSRYLRQLELSVLFSHEETEFAWQGKISDQLTKAQLKSLLENEFPVKISGNYSKDEPAMIVIVLTTLSVFSLGAALFFIRT